MSSSTGWEEGTTLFTVLFQTKPLPRVRFDLALGRDLVRFPAIALSPNNLRLRHFRPFLLHVVECKRQTLLGVLLASARAYLPGERLGWSPPRSPVEITLL